MRFGPATTLMTAMLIAPIALPTSTRTAFGQVTLNAACTPRVKTLANGFGAPDDLAVRGRHILFGDIRAGEVVELSGGRRQILVRHLRVPEGMVVAGKHKLIVVEQALNRLDVINLKTGRSSVLLRLKNGTGAAGVDGIAGSAGNLIIPNSPYGTVLRLHGGRLSTLVSGLSRPTDATGYRGGLAIADENADAIWMLRKGRRTKLASLPTPDDVAVVGKALLAVTLGDGSLWEIKPRVRRISRIFSQPQGLLSLGHRTVIVADSAQNRIVRLSLSKGCLR